MSASAGPAPKDRLGVVLEPEGTIVGDWQAARTEAVSAMFDAGPDECGIYQTTQLYVALDAAFRGALEAVVRDCAAATLAPVVVVRRDTSPGAAYAQGLSAAAESILRYWGLEEKP